MREVDAQLEPLFFLYEGEPPARRPDREPDIEVEGARLWRLPPDGIQEAFADRQLLIADGHHRYETALAYGPDVEVLAVLVSLDDPGLMIFPTHRVFERAPGEQLAAEETLPDPEKALEALERVPHDRAAAVVYRDGRSELAVDGNELDVQLVDRLGHEGISYTPDWQQAVARGRLGRGRGRGADAPDEDRGRLRRRQARRDDAAEEHLLLSEARLGPALPASCVTTG